MTFFLPIIAGLFGLFIGSFLNAVIYRLQSGESIVRPSDRSHCRDCGHTLAGRDLIPLISFILLRGRCRYCHKKISLQYPAVELATAALFVFIAWYVAQTYNPVTSTTHYILHAAYLLIIFSSLLVIFVYDLKHYLIPDKILFPIVGVALLYRVLEFINLNLGFVSDFRFQISDSGGPTGALASAVLASGFFFSLFYISKGRWMGFGDVKLAFFMGLFLGFPNILVALFFAFIAGAIIGVALIVASVKTLKSQVPFGPFLITGTFVAFFWGSAFISWYLNLFLS